MKRAAVFVIALLLTFMLVAGAIDLWHNRMPLRHWVKSIPGNSSFTIYRAGLGTMI